MDISIKRYVHIFGEIMALIIVVPFLLHLLYKYKFNDIERMILILMIIFTILIDGWLLIQWF